LAGVACGVDGFCASAGQEGTGTGLLETGAWSGLPTVSAVSPDQGPVAGGTAVTISGTNFGPDSVASFGGIPVPTTVLGPTQLSAVAPSAKVGLVDVTVSTGGFVSRANDMDRFAYVGAQNRVAGYSRQASGSSAESAGVTFWVPSASCGTMPKGGLQSVDVGARLRTAAGDTIGGVAVSCVGTKAKYSAVIDINGTSTPSTVTASAGEKVVVAISESSASSTITITRGTETQTVTGPGAMVTGEDLGALAAGCNLSNCLSVPRTTVTYYSISSFDGLAPLPSGATLVNLQDAAGQPEIVAAKTGTGTFKTTWKYSCSKTTTC
jgi:hypothetical protein